jgi:putative restriction endonuclease
MNSLLNTYLLKLSKLRTAKFNSIKAPHKPILLLAIIEGITLNEIKENKVYITSELVSRFKDYWQKLVPHTFFSPNFSLPFFHLKSDGFWHLKTYIGQHIALTTSHSIKSFSQLKQVIDYAFFDYELFELLSNKNSREILNQTILNIYFPEQKKFDYHNELVDFIINQILHEHPASYKKEAEGFNEEDVFVRGGIFKKTIPKIYNHTCCISSLRIITDEDNQMIDACHIIPFSESHDDTISNGISLCPNLHRAFDRGLISIDNEYRVIINSFRENSNTYSIKQFDGKPILLPSNKEYYPSLENLEIHRRRFQFLI